MTIKEMYRGCVKKLKMSTLSYRFGILTNHDKHNFLL